MESTSHDTLFTILAVVTSVGILIQAFMLIGMYIGARKAITQATKLMNDVREHVLPTLATSRRLVEELSPKIKVMATNFTDVSHTVRAQTAHINNAMNDVVSRTQKQAHRVDGMVTDTMDGISNTTASIQEGIAVPVRKVNGILSGLRAAIDVLTQRSPMDHVKGDRDLFI